jgi:hypothetical protein
VPEGVADPEAGWIGWLQGCCSLPAWRCHYGDLHPADAAYCTYHGCPRPPLSRVSHEVASGRLGLRDVPPPKLIERALTLAPHPDGRSTPALAGNVLVYLADDGRLVAADMGGDKVISLMHDVEAAALRLVGGAVTGALQAEGSVRYLSWQVTDLRDALTLGADSVPHEPSTATTVHLLGLPRDRTRLHQGAGLLRLVVEHDPVPQEVGDRYEEVTGAPPGEWIVRRTANPSGPKVAHPDLRPMALHQVPIPVPGGIFLLGTVRWFGKVARGALLLPTVATAKPRRRRRA